MNIDEALVFAIEPIIPEISPGLYEGRALEYCVYNYSALPRLHAEGKPGAIVYLVQVHYCLPTGQAAQRTLIQLKNALHCAGCTYPSVEDASDEDGQHYVLECQYMDGDV